MVENELLMAMSDLLGNKLKQELQPMKDDIRALKTDMNDIKADISNMKTDISNMETKISNMETRMSNVEDDVHGIHIYLENVVNKNIQLLAENYVSAAKRYIETADQIEPMRADVDLLKKTVTKHSEILQKFA